MLRMGRIASGVTLAVGIVVPSIHLGAPSTEHWAVGCYSVELGTWEPAIALGMDSVFVTPPSRMRLDTAAVQIPMAPQDVPAARRILPIGPWPGAEYLIGTWSPITSSEGVSLAWTNGFSGFYVNAERRDDGFEGVARTYWDFGRESQTATLVAHRISCSQEGEVQS